MDRKNNILQNKLKYGYKKLNNGYKKLKYG